MINFYYYSINIKKLSAAILTCMLFIGQLFSQTFPSGFSQVKMTAIEAATAMAFAPDGRLFVCQKTGQVRIIKNGVLLATPFLTLTVDQNGERGISGITFDPNFNTNKYVYIYYTRTTPTIHNRLSRFTANGDVVMAGSEVALLDAEPLTAVFHNGGGLGFGPDGKIYLSMGEDNKPNNAQNLDVYKGKLLRINKDGSAPADNPYSSSTSQVRKKIWCLGLRNPYTLAFQPGTGKLFINNVGADNWEEIHDGTAPGKNFGWPAVEGSSSNPTYTNPVYSYPHESASQKGCAITGGTFFNPSSTNYPAQYNGKYFYMDYCNGWMNYITLGSTVTNHLFSSGMGTKNLALQVGPDGNLYYIKRDDAKAGIYKIIYSNNNAPAITQHPANKTITQGQSVTFNVSASGATPLTYQWRKNGVNIAGATASSYTINNVQSSHAGQYSARVTNSFGNATSNNATLTVTGFNAQPVAQINIPAEGTKFRAGDVINFSGNATDAEDGTLPASAFEWTVEFHHNNNHFHPGPVIPEGIKNGFFTTSNTDHTSANIFYRLKLKVTDSHGLIDTAHVDIHPITSTITINTLPTGLDITFDSQPQTTPFSTLTVEGLLIQMGIVTPQTKNGKTYIFGHWNHGGNASQTIKVGQGDSSYTAVFEETETKSCIAEGKITRDYWTNYTGTTVSGIPINTPPTSSSQLTIFEGPSNAGNHYASRIRGYICPPTTGNYIFWIASDNSSELWLSTNDQPTNKVKIAAVTGYTSSRNWTKYPSQKSAAIALTAGTKYYIEALHREGDQGDNLAVGWQLPNGTQERPIPGSRLSPFTNTGISYTPNTFAVIGDYGSSGPNEAAVADLVKSWNPEFIITAGDNNYPEGAASTIDANVGQYYHDYIKPYSGSYGNGSDVNRFFPTLGNHDWIATSATPYLQYFTLPNNERYYDFVKGNVHFFAIDSDPHEPNGNSSSSVQATWLKNKLAASTSKWKIVYFHHSPYASDEVNGSQSWMQWPFKSWGADIVLSAHSHIYERVLKENFTYLVNGLGGRSKYALKPTPVAGSQIRYNANFGALKVMVRPDTLWFEFYNISNTLIDSYPLIKSSTTECDAKITPGGSTTFCAGGSVLLKATTGTGLNYQWRKNGANIPGATAPTYTANSNGDYQIKITAGGCEDWSAPTKVTVNTSLTAKITPGGPTTFCSGGNVKLYANTCSGYIYQWRKNSVNIPGATSATYIATSTGNYQVKIAQGSAVAWSANHSVTVNACSRTDTTYIIQETPSTTLSDNHFKIDVYPNPNTGLFTFDLCLEEAEEETMQINVLNNMGQSVFSKPAQRIDGCIRETIELNNTLPTGIYILQLNFGNKTENTRILLTK